MSQWATVCSVDDLYPSLGCAALVEGHQIALFKVEDKVYAVDNYDPFSRVNVISRGIVGDLKGQLVVASPVYKQHFSLESGCCLEEPEQKIKVHSVRVRNSAVEVALLLDASQAA